MQTFLLTVSSNLLEAGTINTELQSLQAFFRGVTFSLASICKRNVALCYPILACLFLGGGLVHVHPSNLAKAVSFTHRYFNTIKN